RLFGQRHHGRRRERAGDQPAAGLRAGRLRTDAAYFGQINRREETRKEVDLAFGQNFAEQRIFARDILLDLDWVNDEGETVVYHASQLSPCSCGSPWRG